MKQDLRQFDRVCLRPGSVLGHWFLIAFVLIGSAVWSGRSALSQDALRSRPQPAPEPAELESRVAAASVSRASGNVAATAQANTLVIATALREMATLQSMQGSYPKAIELYKESLGYEPKKVAKLGLAYAEARAGSKVEALKLAREASAEQSNDVQTEKLLGSLLMETGDYKGAAEPFTRLAAADPSMENLYALGNCLLQIRTQESRLRAKAVFEQMKQRAGDNGSLHVLFGRAYRDADDLPAAVEEFHRAAAIDTRTPHVHYFLGLATLALNEWKPTPEAEAEIKLEAQYYPKDYLANYMSGFLASGDRRFDEAYTYLVTASTIDPAAPEPHLYLGLNAYAQSDMKEAEAELRKAVELTGSDEARSNYQIRRAYVDLGRILSGSGRKAEAETFLTKARELQNRTMEQSQQSVANMVLAGGAGSAAAVMPLSRKQEQAEAPPMPPSSAAATQQTAEAREQEHVLRAVLGLAFNDLATTEAIRKDYADAFAHYQEAATWDSSLAGLNKNLGLSAYRSGNFGQAIIPLGKALAETPQNTALRGLLGIAYFNLDQYRDAAKTLAPLGERGMHDGETGYAWAASLAHTGDTSRAAEVLTAFSADARSEAVRLLIGQLWTVIGDYGRATATFQQLLAEYPQLAKAHLYAGLAYIHWQRWPEAEQEFRAELALSPDDPDARYHLGYVSMQQARLDEAVACFRKVVAENPKYSNAAYQLGKILLDRGQVSEAEGYLESAARTSPRTDYVHYQLQVAYRKDNRIADADRELAIYKELKSKSRESAGQGMVANP
jgi:tetratricopeptide (TPR) repeat protein